MGGLIDEVGEGRANASTGDELGLQVGNVVERSQVKDHFNI